jgi:hypothetical protein
MSGQSELDAFVHDPEQYVSPAAPHSLPPPHLLPVRRSESEVKAMFPKSFEIQGFCPVTYVEGKKRCVYVYYNCPALLQHFVHTDMRVWFQENLVLLQSTKINFTVLHQREI